MGFLCPAIGDGSAKIEVKRMNLEALKDEIQEKEDENVSQKRNAKCQDPRPAGTS